MRHTYTNTYVILEIPRPAYEEMRERLLDRQDELTRRAYSECLIEADDGTKMLLIGAGSESAMAFRPIDAGPDGCYPHPDHTRQGPGPMDAARALLLRARTILTLLGMESFAHIVPTAPPPEMRHKLVEEIDAALGFPSRT